jgi:uncharacterized membrane protein YqjE
MNPPSGGGDGREGLFAALKNIVATLVAIGKTRAELFVTEFEEEKIRFLALCSKAVGAAFLLAIGSIMAIFCLVFAFWEQRVIVFGVSAVLFIGGGLYLVGSLKRQASQPSKLFRASLAELEEDMALLRRYRDKAE